VSEQGQRESKNRNRQCLRERPKNIPFLKLKMKLKQTPSPAPPRKQVSAGIRSKSKPTMSTLLGKEDSIDPWYQPFPMQIPRASPRDSLCSLPRYAPKRETDCLFVPAMRCSVLQAATDPEDPHVQPLNTSGNGVLSIAARGGSSQLSQAAVKGSSVALPFSSRRLREMPLHRFISLVVVTITVCGCTGHWNP
jgi:hypothetical protein